MVDGSICHSCVVGLSENAQGVSIQSSSPAALLGGSIIFEGSISNKRSGSEPDVENTSDSNCLAEVNLVVLCSSSE